MPEVVCLAVAGGWLFLRATPRVDGVLRGWRGTLGGLAVMLLAVWRAQAGMALGLGPAVALVLAVVMLALPGLSWLQARRRLVTRQARR